MSESSRPTPTTRDATLLLAEIGTLLELNGGDAFRARAFTNAARALEGSDADLLQLAKENRLTTLRGVGPAIAAILREFLLTGRSGAFEELRASTPLALYDLLRVQGLGAKRIHLLHEALGIEDLDSLEQAARKGKIAGLPGFGAKTEAKILAGIGFARSNRQLRRYHEGLEIGVRLLEWLRERSDVNRGEIVGSLRRRMEVVEQIDLLAATDSGPDVLAAFAGLHGAHDLSHEGHDEATLKLSDGVTARLRCVAPADFVVAMVWETGNEAHINRLAEIAAEKGGSFGRAGLVVKGKPSRVKRESEVYGRLGLAYVAPELREGIGEIERASAGELPPLVELEDLQGTFHCHTTASDGKATLAEMAEGARERGWTYLGIADHSQNASYAGGLTIQEVASQQQEIDALNRTLASDGGAPMHLFKGIEADILADGSLDYPDRILRTFDYVVGSVHSAFRMGEKEMTARMIRAVRHPSLTILGHPTGRLLLTRSGYALDVKAVIEAAAAAGVVIEINANPHRLDLDWREVRRAAELGVLIAVNPDAHSVNALDHVAFGINMARKAGLEPRQVLNSWALDEVKEYFAKRKEIR